MWLRVNLFACLFVCLLLGYLYLHACVLCLFDEFTSNYGATMNLTKLLYDIAL